MILLEERDKDKKYTLLIAVIILISSFAIIALNYFSIRILSSIRAYVNSESQYSKAQKDATSYLTSYINSPDDYYYNLFTKELQVPIGDRIAREAMQKHLEFDKVKDGFLQGRNHTDDIKNLNWMFVNFQMLPYFKDAIAEWTASDGFISQLQNIGTYANKGYQQNNLSFEEKQHLLRSIDSINTKLTHHQQQFSNILGEASRLIAGILIYINIIFITIILMSAGIFARKLINELILSRREIEKQNYAKDEFLSIASHELKTPITSMKASLQILERFASKTTELNKIHPFIVNSNKQVKRLTELVDELMDVTKIQRGKLMINKKMFALHDLIHEVVDEISLLSKHTFKILNMPETYVFADQNRIRQVLVNLLTNAAKYSGEENQIDTHVEYQDENVLVSVRDYGKGISKEKIPLLFERFYRLEETENVVLGLGLGLYISSEIIRNHDGSIGADSEIGKGSTFWFSIPKIK